MDMLHTTITVKFQSTLLQEERPDPGEELVKFLTISIHAPTRGATPTWLHNH